MENRCCDCIYLNRNRSNKNWLSSQETYHCPKNGKYMPLDNLACNLFKPRAINNTGFQPTGCYITTIVHEVLGYDDDCEVLSILRSFRENYLKNRSEYLNILIQYDILGPIICDRIRSEQNNNLLCNGLYKYFLLPCVAEIKSGSYDTAIEIYINMVDQLRDGFGLENIIIPTSPDVNMDILGKGRARVLPANI